MNDEAPTDSESVSEPTPGAEQEGRPSTSAPADCTSPVAERLPRAIQLEMAVVILLGVVAPLCNTVIEWTWPTPAETRQDIYFPRDACLYLQNDVILAAVMLYLLWRSDESWSHWGIVPFVWWRDISLGLALWLTEWFLHDMIQIGLKRYITLSEYTQVWPLPDSTFDYCLLVPMCAAIGFAEELVFRGYLLPRFERALQSTIGAVLTTSVLFAICHLYQGGAGAFGSLLFGLFYGTVFVWLRRLWPLAIAHAMMDVAAFLKW